MIQYLHGTSEPSKKTHLLVKTQVPAVCHQQPKLVLMTPGTKMLTLLGEGISVSPCNLIYECVIILKFDLLIPLT